MTSNDEIKHAYLAGLIDGEGCIFIDKFTQTNGRVVHYPKISIGMTDIKPIQLLSDTFGGKIYFESRQHLNHKDVYIWGTKKIDRVRNVLDSIIPHLRGKKDQAILAREAVDLRTEQMRNYTNLGIEQRLSDIHLNLKNLHAKG